MINQMALLSWTTTKGIQDYLKKVEQQIEKQMKAELEKRKWKVYTLYRSNSKQQLEAMCRKTYR